MCDTYVFVIYLCKYIYIYICDIDCDLIAHTCDMYVTCDVQYMLDM